MGEIAFDALVSEFLWLGIQPRYAHNLAALIYPEEDLEYDDNEEFFKVWIDAIIGASYYRFNDFCPGETFDNYEDAIRKIKKCKNLCRTKIYIDGSNLVRSLKYLKEEMSFTNEILERNVSIKKDNYNTAEEIDEDFPKWFLSWCILASSGVPNIFIEDIVYVMSTINDGIQKYKEDVSYSFGIKVIDANVQGDGFKSCSDEDTILKNMIISDLQKNIFDKAIICSGDGNKKDGISFPEIGERIIKDGKLVQFISFGISTSKKIKDEFEFFDLGHIIYLPKYSGINLLIKED